MFVQSGLAGGLVNQFGCLNQFVPNACVCLCVCWIRSVWWIGQSVWLPESVRTSCVSVCSIRAGWWIWSIDLVNWRAFTCCWRGSLRGQHCLCLLLPASSSESLLTVVVARLCGCVWVCMCVCVFWCVCAFMYTSMYLDVCVHECTHPYVFIHVCVHACVRVCVVHFSWWWTDLQGKLSLASRY